MLTSSDQLTIWKFIRGDLPTPEFEKWLYASSTFEQAVANDFYLKVIATDFRDKSQVYFLKSELEVLLRQKWPSGCECIALADLAVIDQGSEQQHRILTTLIEIKEYGPPLWWLLLYQCNTCQQYWLAAVEQWINDIDIFKRISPEIAAQIIAKNNWPPEFKTFEELLVIAKKYSKEVFFLEYYCDALIDAIQELRNARPNISNAEIAFLLHIDEEQVRKLSDIPHGRASKDDSSK